MMISAFGVDHTGPVQKSLSAADISKRKNKEKRDLTPLKVGALAGVGAAGVIGRGRANRWGASLSSRVSGHADWAAGRATEMKNPAFKAARNAYAVRLRGLGNEIGRSSDTRETAARALTGGAVGGAAGMISNNRRKKDR